MNIKSLQIHVPAGCPNRCKFCVAGQHKKGKYKNILSSEPEFYDASIGWAKENGCNCMVISSTGEPLVNPNYIERVLKTNKSLTTPFRWIELQTSGAGYDQVDMHRLKELGLRTISLSLSSIWDSGENKEYNQARKNFFVNITAICTDIIDMGFNLRLSLNMTDYQLNRDRRTPKALIERANDLGATSITFRKLYADFDTVQGKWIKEHGTNSHLWKCLTNYITANGTLGERLPSGDVRYYINEMSTVIYDDCMDKKNDTDNFRYLILRPNGKLYTKWDNDGSILF